MRFLEGLVKALGAMPTDTLLILLAFAALALAAFVVHVVATLGRRRP